MNRNLLHKLISWHLFSLIHLLAVFIAFCLASQVNDDNSRRNIYLNGNYANKLSAFTSMEKSKLYVAHVFHHNTGAYEMSFKRHDTSFYNMILNNHNDEQKISENSDLLSSLPSFEIEHGILSNAEDEEKESARPFLLNKRMPNPSEPNTVLQLAYMSNHAYKYPAEQNWQDLGDTWNKSSNFGWEKDGVRGYVFTDITKRVMVLAIKGTSASLFGIGGGPTSAKDKYNDNMMFSCCCAKVDLTWRPICDCCESITGSRECSTSCIRRHASFADSYYNLAQTIATTVKSLYPQTAIWMTGHSLGGSLASLVAITNQMPAFTFEAPGELLYAQRIGLIPKFSDPLEKEKYLKAFHVYHFGNTGDPVFLGLCNGPTSSCYFSGYAMESKCHAGKVCVYDKSKQNLDEYELMRLKNINTSDSKLLKLVTPSDPNYRGASLNTATHSSSSSVNRNARFFSQREELSSNSIMALNAKEKQEFRALQRLDIRYHRLAYFIPNFLEKWDHVPECFVEATCEDCHGWEWDD